MKKVYTAPEAQIVLLAPSDGIASNWTEADGNWKANDLFWKQASDIPDSPASGKTFWFDFGTDEFK